MSWVIVTGANGGIGAATVHELIKNNYSVCAADLAETPHESFAAYSDTTFRYSPVNVGDEESVRRSHMPPLRWGSPLKVPCSRRGSPTASRS